MFLNDYHWVFNENADDMMDVNCCNAAHSVQMVPRSKKFISRCRDIRIVRLFSFPGAKLFSFLVLTDVGTSISLKNFISVELFEICKIMTDCKLFLQFSL